MSLDDRVHMAGFCLYLYEKSEIKRPKTKRSERKVGVVWIESSKAGSERDDLPTNAETS